MFTIHRYIGINSNTETRRNKARIYLVSLITLTQLLLIIVLGVYYVMEMINYGNYATPEIDVICKRIFRILIFV